VRAIVSAVAVALIAAASVLPASTTLDIYAVDVEGGKAALVVTPSGESLLIDSGNIGEGAGRDAGRILAAIRHAGVQRIDHLVTTHWHRDHMGAIPQLAAQIPILEYIDHGENSQPDAAVDAFLRDGYPALYAKARRTIARPGDRIPMADLDVTVVSSAGEVLKKALPGAGAANPYCPGTPPARVSHTENTHSIGFHLSFGRFRVVDLADLTSDREFDLVCPNNLLGRADLFMVSHHGQAAANSEPLVHAIEARAAIMNNGVLKGGQPEVMHVIYSAPGLEDLWQLHASRLGGQEYTAPGLFIANHVEPSLRVAPTPTPPRRSEVPVPLRHDGTAYWIKVSADRDGSFSVTNGRNGFTKAYRARGH
jgi:beta-lactamase superfamily II metal-dependent hydrolase